MITKWQRELNYAELENKKGAIPQCFEESPLELGIIRYTAQYQGAMGVFQSIVAGKDLINNTKLKASARATAVWSNRSNESIGKRLRGE